MSDHDSEPGFRIRLTMWMGDVLHVEPDAVSSENRRHINYLYVLGLDVGFSSRVTNSPLEAT